MSFLTAMASELCLLVHPASGRPACDRALDHPGRHSWEMLTADDPATITRAAAWLHDQWCYDADSTADCPGWGEDQRHREYYEACAAGMLAAAAQS